MSHPGAGIKALVANGVLVQVPAADGGPYAEYALTEMGKGLFPVIVGLRQWGEDHAARQKRSRLVDRAQEKLVGRLVVVSADGRPLQPDDVVVRKPA